MDATEPSSDPALLFTPKRTKGHPAELELAPQVPHPVNKPQPYRVHVVIPPISDEEKKLYKPFQADLLDVLARDVDEVIGEDNDQGVLYYFARYQQGPAYKFNAIPFVEKYPNLVDQFNRNKADGILAPFHPSADYVHPSSRKKMTILLRNTRAAVSMLSSRPTSSVVPDSQEDFDDSESSRGSDYDSGDGSSIRQRPTRADRKRFLPFSPRKTRSRRVYLVDSDMEDDESEDSVILEPSRRSTRVRKGVKVKLDADSDFEAANSEGGSGAYKLRLTTSGGVREAKKGVAQPAYGYFRSVIDLDYDPASDGSVLIGKHREICERCHRAPTHQLLQKLSKNGKPKLKRRSSQDEFDSSGDEKSKVMAFGGWVRCLKCPVVAHWKCIASNQRDEILKAARVRDLAESRHLQPEPGQQNGEELKQPETSKRIGLDVNQTTEFICSACTKGGFCMGCMEVISMPNVKSSVSGLGALPGVPNNDGGNDTSKDHSDTLGTTDRQLLFRCLTCKRPAHYEHMPLPPGYFSDASVTETAAHYTQTWICANCASFTFGVDKILAWRPYPLNAVGPSLEDAALAYKNSLPREYLIKWLDRSYRRVQWVPHMWLLSTHPAKLKNFLAGGSKVELLKVDDPVTVDDHTLPSFEAEQDSRASSVKPGAITPASPQDALPDAERRIPPGWKTIDRILDVLLLCPRRQPTKASRHKRKGKQKARNTNSDQSGIEDEVADAERVLAFDKGEQPSDEFMETVSEWERRTKDTFSLKAIDQVIWLFIKWKDLGYDESTWDSPPRITDSTYPAFQTALERFIDSHRVVVHVQPPSYYAKFDKRAKDEYWTNHRLKNAVDLNIGQNRDLELMPFQVDGFNWLCNNWWTRQHCILADEMGLGKTVQIATFLGRIAENFKAFPALVVVPNSTITNWVREFERWAPRLRIVPFYGEAKARDIIKKFELYHTTQRRGETGAKFHVLITTYEALLNQKDFTSVFKNQPRWEVLVVDEGQRLKSDSSLLFKRLNELKSLHRIIMTGTPLNNNIRELFNLMNFLDPNEWNDLQNLEKEHEELTEELVKQLHNRLRPYFLRRLKTEVLQLPPKNEVIVPVSMAPLQKEVYRSVLGRNLEILHGLTQQSSKVNTAPAKGRLNNVLMELRKCLQHPYLNAQDLEPPGLSSQESHEKLIDGSAKLRLLKFLLPKLRERGHRVLLFSQFVIALDIVEDFLNGEGYKYLRLDGNTKGGERQKGMDEFNKSGSDIFIYLLTTRAGGVGINLSTADTVIIFDPDFNPHQDLQAIARAYRFGQKKTCLVFKLMVKDSAEERIMQVGKKKLALDHLIVQKMDEADSAGENFQSILTYGAQALFDEGQNSRDIIYTEQDIEKLVERTEKEGDEQEQVKEGLSFAFAKVWAADKDTFQEVEDVDQVDSWAQTLQKLTEEREKTRSEDVALSGRGAKRRAAAISKPNLYRDGPFDDTVGKPPSSVKSRTSEASGYVVSDIESASDIATDEEASPLVGIDDLTFRSSVHKVKGKSLTETSPEHTGRSRVVPDFNYTNQQYCGLCEGTHSPGECNMTQRSENLAEFREMLLLYADDEPWEERKAAIYAIDMTLHQRGHVHLIAGQPLHLLQKPDVAVILPHSKPTTNNAMHLAVPQTSRPQLESLHSTHTKYTNTQFVAVGQQTRNVVPGPSKRPASPTVVGQPKPKKSKKPVVSVSPSTAMKQHMTNAVPGLSKRPVSPTIVDQSESKSKKLVESAPSTSAATKAVPRSSTHSVSLAVVEHPQLKEPKKLVVSGPSNTAAKQQLTNPVPASSRRPASPTNVEQPKPQKTKKPVVSAPPTPCLVCEQLPHHLVKDCPIVAKGAKSIARQIVRLEANPEPSAVATVRVLHQLYTKHMKSETIAIDD